MPTPHKHANLIKAWADGAKIEMLTNDYSPEGDYGNSWKPVNIPSWNPLLEYRIKPEPQVIEGFCWEYMADGWYIFSKHLRVGIPPKKAILTLHPDE